MASSSDERTIDFRWDVRDSPDSFEVHVDESVDGKLQYSYGPMPRGSVEAFILERKRAVTDIFMRLYAPSSQAQG